MENKVPYHYCSGDSDLCKKAKAAIENAYKGVL